MGGNLTSKIRVPHNKFQSKTSTFTASKEKNMKKTVALVVLAASIMLTSCSSYTCPTYSKAPQKVAAKESKI